MNYSYSTEKSYISWIKRFILFHDKRHPGDMGEVEIESFLTHLAVQKNVAPSTQNQALAALQFLYQKVLRLPLDDEILPVPAKRSKHLPVVLSRQEARAVLNELSGTYLLICQLLYGCGLRVTECLTLRIKDLDFDCNEITVHQSLIRYLRGVKLSYEIALEEGYGTVKLPRALGR